jgi:hypothetical protein
MKEIDLLDLETLITEPFYFSEATDTGILLATNIAFLFDWEKPEAYDIVTGFRSVVTEAGISIGLSSTDYVQAFYSVLGGGVLMPDLMYTQNRLPITGVSTLNALAIINDRFGVFTDTTLYIMEENEIEGVLVFRTNDTVHLGVKNIDDIAQVQGGVLVHTRNGIYLTSGSAMSLISEAINDIVRLYYSQGYIRYNRHLNELYYRPSLSSEDLYRYRFEDQVWERINATIEGGALPAPIED